MDNIHIKSILLALIGCVIGLGIATIYELTQWWQILLCIICSIAGVFAIVYLVILILGIVLFLLLKKWWEEHGTEFILQVKSKVKRLIRCFFKVIFTR